MEKLSDRIYVLQINTKPVENQYECYEVSDTSIKIKKTTNKDKYKMKKSCGMQLCTQNCDFKKAFIIICIFEILIYGVTLTSA